MTRTAATCKACKLAEAEPDAGYIMHGCVDCSVRALASSAIDVSQRTGRPVEEVFQAAKMWAQRIETGA
jgi:hypothetical protein